MSAASAIVWIAVFSLALHDVVVRGRRNGFGSLRFLTRRRSAAYALSFIGTALGTFFVYLFAKGVFTGRVVCRGCDQYALSIADDTTGFALIAVAYLTLAATMFFMAFLARNSLRAIREGRA